VPLGPSFDRSSEVQDSVTSSFHVTRFVASIRAQKNRAGSAYRVPRRAGGRQQSLTFENLLSAQRFRLFEDHGPEEALRIIIELDELGRHVPTVTEWLNTTSTT
jgi:integrase